MTDEHKPGAPGKGEDDDPLRKKPMWERRRDKIREEIARNRRGEYTVPTWVLVVALVAIIAAWAAIIVFA